MGRTRVVAPQQQSMPFSTGDVHAPAAATAAIVTYAAITSTSGTAGVMNQPTPVGYLTSAGLPNTVSHVIRGFRATVDAAAIASTAPSIKIEDGSGNIVFQTHLEMTTDGKSDAAGRALYSLSYTFPTPMKGTAGRAMIITMPSNGSGTTNRLCVVGHTTEIA